MAWYGSQANDGLYTIPDGTLSNHGNSFGTLAHVAAEGWPTGRLASRELPQVYLCNWSDPVRTMSPGSGIGGFKRFLDVLQITYTPSRWVNKMLLVWRSERQLNL